MGTKKTSKVYKTIETEILDKETGEILKVDYVWSFLKNKYYKDSTYKIDDLIKDNLVVKVED